MHFSVRACWCSFGCWHSVLNRHDILCLLIFSQVDMVVNKYNNVEHTAPSCNEMYTTCMRRIEKQMHAHPHVRLGCGSKDTAHMCRHFNCDNPCLCWLNTYNGWQRNKVGKHYHDVCQIENAKTRVPCQMLFIGIHPVGKVSVLVRLLYHKHS